MKGREGESCEIQFSKTRFVLLVEPFVISQSGRKESFGVSGWGEPKWSWG